MGRREDLAARLQQLEGGQVQPNTISRRERLQGRLTQLESPKAIPQATPQVDTQVVQQPQPFQGDIISSQMIPGQAQDIKPQPGFIENQIQKPLRQAGRVIQEGLIAPIETVGTLAANIGGEALAGLTGLATLPFDDATKAESNMNAVRDALSVIPPSLEGQAMLRKVAEALQPAAETVEAAQKQLGDAVLDVTGSEVAGAIGQAVPDALLSLTGVKIPRLSSIAKAPIKVGKSIQNIASKNPKQLLTEAAPTVSDLKSAARKVYGNLDNSGVSIRTSSLETLAGQVKDLAVKQGFNKAIQPKIAPVLEEFKNAATSPKTLTEIDTLRKVAQGAAKSIDKSEAAMGSAIVSKVDDFLDNLSPSDVSTGTSKNIGSQFKDARQLWGRARRLEVIEEAMSKANLQASGFENGIRTQFRSILNNKKKSRGFKPDELAAMRKVVKGGKAENIAKALGKFGVSEQQASSMLLSGLGAAAGGAALGVPGAIAVPLIGQVSKGLAQKLTRNNSKLASQVISSGSNGIEVAKAYIKSVPAAQRKASDLTELLLRPNVSLKNLKASVTNGVSTNSTMIANAIFFAEAIKKTQEDKSKNQGDNSE